MPLLSSSSYSGKTTSTNKESSNGKIAPTLVESAVTLKEFTSVIPLRLTARERSLLAVLESTLHVSEYTDHVDVAGIRGGGSTKARRVLDGILESCYLGTGLAVVSMQDSQHDFSSSDDRPAATEKKTHKGGIMRRVSLTASTITNMSSKSERQAEKAARKLAKREDKLSKQQRKAPIRRSDSSQEADSLEEDKPCFSEQSLSSPVETRTPQQNEGFLQTFFEIGRRNKVLNPSKMRSTYGKLMYLLQDSQSPTVAKSMGFSLYKDMLMVSTFLNDRMGADNADIFLKDNRLVGATLYVSEWVDGDESGGEKLHREILKELISSKDLLVNELLNDYAAPLSVDEGPTCAGTTNGGSKSNTISREDLQRCIDSISDAIAVVEQNIAPVKRILRLLETNFDPTAPEKEFSLELRGNGLNATSQYYTNSSYGRFGMSTFGGRGGASIGGPTLSHSHSTQFTFVWQSLHLWCEVQRNMHRLWVCADDDLLSTNTSYQLLNTGQGLHRVQNCPRVAKVMRSLIAKTQKAAGAPWVGLSVVHLGDRDVPNALVFIDKYTQIPRFLKPIVDFVDAIPNLCSDGRIDTYIKEQFGSERNLKMTVLADYFKHGFDGSGDDGGSCIDGRLTSSWNWTSRLAKKRYYHAFMLSGFQGFDGEFK